MKQVLFVCNHNAGRSQMAQAFFDRHAPADVRAESAGSHPARQVWPEVVEVMREVGIDLSDRRPRKLLREMQLQADWAVTIRARRGVRGNATTQTTSERARTPSSPRYDDAPVRSYVSTLALRQARECLRKERATCWR